MFCPPPSLIPNSHTYTPARGTVIENGVAKSVNVEPALMNVPDEDAVAVNPEPPRKIHFDAVELHCKFHAYVGVVVLSTRIASCPFVGEPGRVVAGVANEEEGVTHCVLKLVASILLSI
jgi:hypothetical protein